jgi:hypothetical protein
MTHAEATHRPPEVAHEAGFFSVFCDGPVPGLVSAKANRGRVCRPIANPTPILSRAGEMRIGSVLVLRRERNRCLTRLCRVTCSGTNGPSWPKPNNHVMDRKVTEHLACMSLMRSLSPVGDFVSRLGATKSPMICGCFRARTARSDRFSFAFRHFCEIEGSTLRLVSWVLGLGLIAASLPLPQRAVAGHGSLRVILVALVGNDHVDLRPR